ncbi:MAG: hypothetical protein Fur0014_20360 [Rubrivivax sp.]
MRPLLIAALAAAFSTGATAQSLNLANYQPSDSYALDRLVGQGGMGLEASAVTYARDRGTLFFVGDEGLGVVEVSRTGQTLGTMRFDWAGTGSTHNDTEGLTYLGDGRLVVVEERLQRAYRFDYTAGATVALGSAPSATISTWVPNNIGIEGISVDPRDGSFVTVKQDADGNAARGPQEVRAGALDFAVGGGTAGLPVLFDANLLGLASLSDVQTLAGVDALAGTAAADHLLILSLDSKRLVEATRSGQVVSWLDLSGLTATQAIEGVTIDERGVIYLVAEQAQGSGAPADAASRLFVLTPVPEPSSAALLAAGLAFAGWRVRRSSRTTGAN